MCLIQKSTFNLSVHDSLLKENKLVVYTVPHADVLTGFKM